MTPANLSRLAASLADSELSASARLVLLSLAAATGPDNIAHLTAGRLGARCGLSRGHVARLLRELLEAGQITAEAVPGRASRFTVKVPESARGCSAGALGATKGCSAGALGVARRRARGVAPARYVSSTTPSQLSAPASAGGLKGPPPPAWDSAYVPDDGSGVVTGLRRDLLLGQVRNALRGGLKNAV